MPNTCYMLYILVFTHIFLSFQMLHEIDVVLALLVSDEQGNAKALTSGTSDRTGSTFSCIYTNHLLIMPIW